MNILKGIIATVQVHGNLSLLHLVTGETPLKAVVIESPEWLQEGAPVDVMFKETEVIIGTNEDHAISLQNRFLCTIEKVEKGELLSRLVMQHMEGKIVSVITTAAVRQLGLEAGKKVIAMVKTNELMIRRRVGGVGGVGK